MIEQSVPRAFVYGAIIGIICGFSQGGCDRCVSEPALTGASQQPEDARAEKRRDEMRKSYLDMVARVDQRLTESLRDVNLPANDKDNAATAMAIAKRLVADEINKQGLDEFLRIYEGGAPESRGSQTSVLFCSLIDWLLARGDREALVRVIAAGCDEQIWGSRLEFYLANAGSRTIQDPVSILFDAYQRARYQEPRSTVVRSLRRAFPEIASTTSDDDKFLQSCRGWYEEHKLGLELNPEYGWTGINRPPLVGRVSLFREKKPG